MSSPPLRILVLGSCVGRDAVETMPASEYVLQRYVARRSLLSWGTDATGHLPRGLRVESDFQKRNVVEDARGQLLDVIAPLADQIDVLLWDLVDERHGACRFPDGSWITRTVDGVTHPQLRDVMSRGELFSLGTDSHFLRWSHAADRFVAELRSLNLLSKTLLLDVSWASLTDSGHATPASMGLTAKKAEELYRPYFDWLRELGVRSLRIANTTADPDHRWGLAPFHFTQDVYADIVAGIRARNASP